VRAVVSSSVTCVKFNRNRFYFVQIYALFWEELEFELRALHLLLYYLLYCSSHASAPFCFGIFFRLGLIFAYG
jgi:hypothetical protein